MKHSKVNIFFQVLFIIFSVLIFLLPRLIHTFPFLLLFFDILYFFFLQCCCFFQSSLLAGLVCTVFHCIYYYSLHNTLLLITFFFSLIFIWFALLIFSWITLGSSNRDSQCNNKFRWSYLIILHCFVDLLAKVSPSWPFASITEYTSFSQYDFILPVPPLSGNIPY